MTLDDATEEMVVLEQLAKIDFQKSAEYLLRLVTEAYNSGWDAAFDTAPDNFKPMPRKTKFRERLWG